MRFGPAAAKHLLIAARADRPRLRQSCTSLLPPTLRGVTCARAAMPDQYRESKADVLRAFAIVALVAAALSFCLPSSTLPAPWGRVSDIMGYLYTAAWSYSFYPQVILNWKRKSVVGLSLDFQMLNFLGFSLYSAYNVSLYFIPSIRQAYTQVYSANIPVGLEDVCFSVHALLITSATLVQCMVYERGEQKFMTPIGKAAVLAGVIAATSAAVVPLSHELELLPSVFTWLNWLQLLSMGKLAISLIKYIPQARLNAIRKSTTGWSIVNVLLDATGGSLSMFQLILQCVVRSDWTQIAGNPVKFGLGLLSLSFDLLFMFQHYVLYPAAHSYAPEREQDPLLTVEASQEQQ